MWLHVLHKVIVQVFSFLSKGASSTRATRILPAWWNAGTAQVECTLWASSGSAQLFLVQIVHDRLNLAQLSRIAV